MLDLTSGLKGGHSIARHDLDIEGGGLAEVQNLVDDVGRLEEELRIRELVHKPAAQLLHIGPGGALAIFQAHEDLAVKASDRCPVRIGEVDSEYRQANVVENAIELLFGNNLTDDLLHLCEELFGFFNARSG